MLLLNKEYEMQEKPTFTSIDEAIKAYVDTRDQLRARQHEFKIEEEGLKTVLEQISMWLRDKADELGVDSFKSNQYGTAFRSIKTSYRVATGQWDTFIGWVKETGNFQCLEKRVAKLATAEIYKETGVVPPGLDHIVEVEMDVRRPTK
jgi:translation initiation factor 2 beta subunit (eIF-2beta)/eIF-5